MFQTTNQKLYVDMAPQNGLVVSLKTYWHLRVRAWALLIRPKCVFAITVPSLLHRNQSEQKKIPCTVESKPRTHEIPHQMEGLRRTAANPVGDNSSWLRNLRRCGRCASVTPAGTRQTEPSAPVFTAAELVQIGNNPNNGIRRRHVEATR